MAGVVWVTFRNSTTGQIAGPFPGDSELADLYSIQFPLWQIASREERDGNQPIDGGPVNPNEPIPPRRPILTPGDAPPGSVFIMEDFIDLITGLSGTINHDNYLSTMVGSDEWKSLDGNTGRFRPGFRHIYTWSTPYNQPTTNPVAYVLKDGHPQGVPPATYKDGHFDCWHIGMFEKSDINNTQAQWDASQSCKVGDDVPPPPPLVPPPPPNQNCGFYDCPSNAGSGPCCHDYTDVFKAIQKAIESITSQLAKTVSDSCDLSDKCLDKITDEIWKRLNKSKKTCKQCCDYLNGKVSSQSEEYFICSQMDCDCAETHCGPISEGGDGTPCETGVWHAYCNQSSGEYRVTQSTEPFAFPWTFLGEYDTEADAREAAARECRGQQPTPEQPYVPPANPPQIGRPRGVCDLNSYTSSAGIAGIVSNLSGTINATYAQDVMVQAVSDAQRSTSWIPIVGGLTGTVEAAAVSKVTLAKAFQPQIAALMGCEDDGEIGPASAVAAAAIVEEYTGVSMSEFAPHLAYALHATCRNRQMNPGESIQSYLYAGMDRSRIDTHFAIAGYCEGIAEYQINVLRRKLSPLDLATLRHREKISPSEYNARIRELGYIHTTDADEIYELTNVVPPPSDIIRMMVRDADDKTVAETFHTDDGFPEKFADQLKQWARDQGIPEKYMQYLWRAHWTIPAPGQLFTMYHRLRHNNPFGADGDLRANIEKALVQQDILPFWIKYYLAISFKPLTRVDTRRAFNLGSLDEAGVLKSYYDQGYSDDNAQALLKFTIKLRDQSAVSHRGIKLWQKLAITRAEAEKMMTDDGLPLAVVNSAMAIASAGFASSWPVKAFISGDMPSNDASQKLRDFGVDANAIASIMQAAAPSVRRHNVLARYAAGLVDRVTALGEMNVYGMAPDRSNRQLDKVDFAFEASHSIQCQAAIKQRFLLGEYDDVAASRQLRANGVVKERADKLLSSWQCEKSSIGRAVPGQTLCEWLSQGVINPQNFVQRLVNIGYTANDAAQMFVDCQGNINQKQAAAALKRAKADAAAMAKQQRQADLAEKQLQKAETDRLRGIKLAQDARKRRASAIIKAAEKLYAKVEAPLSSVLDKVNKVNVYLTDVMGLTPDESIEALLRASETMGEGSLDDYDAVAAAFGKGIVDKVMEPDEPPRNGN